MRLLALTGAAFTIMTSAAIADETRDYDLDAFSAVKIATGVSAEITIGDTQTIRVETDKGDFDDLTIEVENGVLKIRRKSKLNFGRKQAKYKVYATAEALGAIDASSGSSVEAEGVDSNDFSIDASSGSYVEVKGKCSRINVDVSSGASVKARDLICGKADADASSGASVSVFASEEAGAEASSGASVQIYGGPTKVETDKSSGGSVRIQ